MKNFLFLTKQKHHICFIKMKMNETFIFLTKTNLLLWVYFFLCDFSRKSNEKWVSLFSQFFLPFIHFKWWWFWHFSCLNDSFISFCIYSVCVCVRCHIQNIKYNFFLKNFFLLLLFHSLKRIKTVHTRKKSYCFSFFSWILQRELIKIESRKKWKKENFFFLLFSTDSFYYIHHYHHHHQLKYITSF